MENYNIDHILNSGQGLTKDAPPPPMSIEKIKAGIAAYSDEQEEIKALIRKHDNRLTEKEFDNEFSNYRDRLITSEEDCPEGNRVGDMVREYKKTPKLRMWSFRPGAFMLARGPSDKYAMLDLVQLMMSAGILTAIKDVLNDGMIVYSIKGVENDNAKMSH